MNGLSRFCDAVGGVLLIVTGILGLVGVEAWALLLPAGFALVVAAILSG